MRAVYSRLTSAEMKSWIVSSGQPTLRNRRIISARSRDCSAFHTGPAEAAAEADCRGAITRSPGFCSPVAAFAMAAGRTGLVFSHKRARIMLAAKETAMSHESFIVGEAGQA